ncbi:MAG: ATP-dependent Clp protease proteolytic subunit [Oscillospiraceae bacterium]|nr:ATP-dependent Clp protease proteolytic subunit [Oscillospiraceae bacterium]
MYIKKVDKSGKDFVDLTSHIFAENRKISIIGEITDRTAMETVFQLEYLDSISDDDIRIYVNSPGGIVSAGLSVVDAMNRCKSDIVTICTGTAASMGAVIVSCGSKGKRFITPFAEMMIHQPLGGAVGQASDIERQAAHIVQTKQKLTEILVAVTGKSADIITADCDRDYYMSAAGAVEYGLVDGVAESNIL